MDLTRKMDFPEGTIVEYDIPWLSDKDRVAKMPPTITTFVGIMGGIYEIAGKPAGRWVIPQRINIQDSWYRFHYELAPPDKIPMYPHLFMTKGTMGVGLMEDLQMGKRLPNAFQVYATNWNQSDI